MIYKGIGAPTPPTTFTVSAEVKSTSTGIIFGIGAYEGGGTSDVDTNFTVTTDTWVKISRTYSNVSYGKIGVFLQPQRDVDVLQVKNVQLESGTTATDYAPYSNICPIHGTDKVNWFVEESYDQSATPKAVITLPQTVYTATISEQGGESRWGKIVLDGTENWVIGSSGEGFWTACDSLAKLTDYTNAIICDKLKTYSSNGSTYYRQAESGITGYVTTVYPNQNWIYAKVPNVTNATEFKAWLAENPITVVYELATLTTFSVPSVTIPTPTGTATTWAMAEDGIVDSMSVTYVGKASS